MGTQVSTSCCDCQEKTTAPSSTIKDSCQKVGKPKCIGLEVEPFRIPRYDDNLISAVDLYNVLNDGNKYSCYIHDPLYVLLLDTRNFEDYNVDHIQSAMHCTAVSSDFINQNLNQYNHIILYGTDTKLDKSRHTDNMVAILENYHLDFKILIGGYAEFHKRFVFMCNANVSWSRNLCECKETVYPSLILEDWLYQGSGEQAKNKHILKSMGITHILNITTDMGCIVPEISYLHIQLQDDSSSRLIDRFEDIFEFLDGVRRTKGRALVHCNLGISRSSTATLSYIMLSKSCCLSDAMYYLLHRRPVCAPNRGFFLQLGEFEEYIFGKSITDAGELWRTI
ncbi:hypothetical protein EB796_022969 [Bugula neritina]|uniref:protein-tyrosine-phosphatase n=1 Tax=Bugula neritina TaxID=10212 RepID=A0A7J7IYT6_BUGNE|nr:hypothetical protein EB796_022969 [Bugula neritina]